MRLKKINYLLISFKDVKNNCILPLNNYSKYYFTARGSYKFINTASNASCLRFDVGLADCTVSTRGSAHFSATADLPARAINLIKFHALSHQLARLFLAQYLLII